LRGRAPRTPERTRRPRGRAPSRPERDLEAPPGEARWRALKILGDSTRRRDSPPAGPSAGLPPIRPGVKKLRITCLDLEGVLVPEIWVHVAERTGIDSLRRTTRDEPDYDVLMRGRLEILGREGIRLPDIEAVIAEMGPMPGAREFLDWLRERMQVVILSDTFYPFAGPLMRQLGWPTLFCHQLEVDDAGRIIDYALRMPDQKRAAVEAFRKLAFQVIAAGDSYNDTSMLGAAHAGILFRPPENVVAEFPQFPVTRDYGELREAILKAESELAKS
jgi:phosphoserine/homoserine phosphotransferase